MSNSHFSYNFDIKRCPKKKADILVKNSFLGIQKSKGLRVISDVSNDCAYKFDFSKKRLLKSYVHNSYSIINKSNYRISDVTLPEELKVKLDIITHVVLFDNEIIGCCCLNFASKYEFQPYIFLCDADYSLELFYFIISFIEDSGIGSHRDAARMNS